MANLITIRIHANNPGPMTGSGNHTYLLMGAGDAATLVDAGVGNAGHLASLDRKLREHGATLTRVLATHGHRDHVEGAPILARRHAGAVFAKFPWPEQDARDGIAWQPLVDGESVLVGDQTLTVLHTPGHSPDHVAFWHEATRIAFTGDLIIEGGSVMIHWSRGGSLSQYLASIARLIELRPATLFPAHGRVIKDPIAALTTSREHRRARERQVIAALREGHSSVAAIT